MASAKVAATSIGVVEPLPIRFQPLAIATVEIPRVVVVVDTIVVDVVAAVVDDVVDVVETAGSGPTPVLATESLPRLR